MTEPRTLDLSKAPQRLAGATADHPIIVRFMDEIREVARTHPQITEAHIEAVETALANGHYAAAESVELMQLWDDVRRVIMQRDKSVKERLTEMGRLAERFDEMSRGRSH